MNPLWTYILGLVTGGAVGFVVGYGERLVRRMERMMEGRKR